MLEQLNNNYIIARLKKPEPIKELLRSSLTLSLEAAHWLRNRYSSLRRQIPINSTIDLSRALQESKAVLKRKAILLITILSGLCVQVLHAFLIVMSKLLPLQRKQYQEVVLTRNLEDPEAPLTLPRSIVKVTIKNGRI